jgi:hypothetical protein
MPRMAVESITSLHPAQIAIIYPEIATFCMNFALFSNDLNIFYVKIPL